MLQDSVRLDPICPLGYFYLARITSRENKHAQAVELYEKALFHGFSRTQEFDMTYANSLQHIPERREEVTQMLSPYVESSAGASDALYALLWAVAVWQEKYVEAQQYYVKALAENEFEQWYFVSLADVLAKQEKFEDAAIVLLKWYQLDETKLNLLMRRYVYLVQSGKTEEELADQYARLMSLIWTNKGLYIQFAKQLHEAWFDTQLEIVLQRLFTLDPNNKDWHAIRRDVAVETIMSELRVLDQEWSAWVIETIETAQSFLATEYSTQAITNILDTIVYAKSGDLVSALRAYQLARPVATDSLTNKNIASLLMMYAIYEQDDAMLAAWFDAYAAEITNEKQSNQFAEDAANRIAALDREQLLVWRLVSHFLDQEADRDAFGDELELIDFRFADDQYVYDNAIKIFSYDKKVLQRYYPDFVDPIFEQEEESEGDVFWDESDLFDIIDAPAWTVQ